MRSWPFAVLALASTACGGDDARLDWRVSFDPASLAPTARVIELTVLQDTCRGRELHRWTIARGSEPRVEAVLPRARYAFRARAGDADCIWFAEECQIADLPRPEPIDQVLTAIGSPIPACGPAACRDGRCDVPDAGPIDSGGIDSGPPDAGPPPPDTGPPPDAGCEEAMPCFGEGFSGPGSCVSGSCCTGCVTRGLDGAGTCHPGTTMENCGVAGFFCVPCGKGNSCASGMCMSSGSGGP